MEVLVLLDSFDCAQVVVGKSQRQEGVSSVVESLSKSAEAASENGVIEVLLFNLVQETRSSRGLNHEVQEFLRRDFSILVFVYCFEEILEGLVVSDVLLLAQLGVQRLCFLIVQVTIVIFVGKSVRALNVTDELFFAGV